MRRISKRPDICPICGDLTLYVISGSYVFKTPVNVKPEVIVIDDVEWEHCNNCGEDFLPGTISREIERRANKTRKNGRIT